MSTTVSAQSVGSLSTTSTAAAAPGLPPGQAKKVPDVVSSLSPVVAPVAAIPAAALPPGQTKKVQPAPPPTPAASPAPAPAPPAAAPALGGGGLPAISLSGSAPGLQASGLLVPATFTSAPVIVTAAPSPIPALFGPSSTSRPAPAPAAKRPSLPTPAPAAKKAPEILPGAFGEPMVLAQGAWHGLSLRAATDLRIPIGLLAAVGVFLLAQALVDRRDPKVTAAPERGTDDTVGFQ